MRICSPLDPGLDRRTGSERLAWVAASRRSFLAGATFGCLSLSDPIVAKAPIPIPLNAMRLHRSLERELYDHGIVRVQRDWVVEFRRRREGAILSGYQLSTQVDAPPVLEPLAQVERQRSTQNLLPISLDPTGRITDAGPLTLKSDFALALVAGLEIWSDHGLSRTNPLEHFRSQLKGPQRASNSALNHLQADLFYPIERAERTTQEIELADGKSGQIELSVSARCQTEHPWLARWERKIVTRIGGSERHSREIWTLSPL